MAEILAHCYGALSAGQHINEATQALMGFYQDPNNFPVLIGFLSACQDETTRKHAVIGVGNCIKFHLMGFQASKEVVTIILQMATSGCEFTREQALHYLRILISEDNYAFYLEFAKTIAESGVPLNMTIALKVAEMCVEFIPSSETPEFAFIMGLISQGADPEAAMLLQITCIPFFGEEQVNATLTQAGTAITAFLGQANLASMQNVTQALCRIVKTGMCGAIAPGLGKLCFDVISNGEIPWDFKKPMMKLLENILKMHCDLFPVEFVQHTIIAYEEIAFAMYDPETPFEESRHYIFYKLLGSFTGSMAVMEHVWGTIVALQDKGPAGRFTAFAVLVNTLEPWKPFYAPRAEVIEQMFVVSLVGSDYCLSTTVAACVKEYYDELKTAVNPGVVAGICSGVRDETRKEYLDALASAFQAIPDTDAIFDECMTWLVGLLQRPGDSMTHQRIVMCIAALANHSHEKIVAHFAQIFPILMTVLGSPDATLKPPAVECIASCCKSCTEQMQECLQPFMEFLQGNMNIPECVEAFGVICEVYTQLIPLEMINQVMSILIANISQSVDIDAEDDDEDFGFTTGFTLQGTSLRVACKLMSIHPEILGTFFAGFIEIIGNLKDSPSGDVTMSCAESCMHICEAILRLEASAILPLLEQMIMVMGSLISSSCDKGTAGAAFRAAAVIYSRPDIPVQTINPPLHNALLNSAVAVLSGNMVFGSGSTEYMYSGMGQLLQNMVSHAELVPALDAELVQAATQILQGGNPTALGTGGPVVVSEDGWWSASA